MPSDEQVRGWSAILAAAALAPGEEDADGALLLMAELQRLQSAAAALQARLAVVVDARRRADEAAAGVPARRRGAGVAAEIGLARQVSANRAQRLLGMARALVTEMSHTRAALADGRLDEWRATLLVRESACLPVEDRRLLDERLCADPRTLTGCGDREVVARARGIAYEIDARSVTRRAAQARGDRRVTLRPAPDTMAYLTALLPVAEGVAAYAALTRAADSARAEGDERGRGQVMADTLVERVTGQARAADVPLQINLVMTDGALLQGSDEPAVVPGYGTVPAGWAREQVAGPDRPAGGSGDRLRRWVRRLYRSPRSGELVALESRARTAPAGLADLVRLRDGSVCRMPWCDAPGRHVDHVVPHDKGGPTSADNLQMLCEAHNYAKEARGWVMQVAAPAGVAVEAVCDGGGASCDSGPSRGGGPSGGGGGGDASRVAAPPGRGESSCRDGRDPDADHADPFADSDPGGDGTGPVVEVCTPSGMVVRSAPPRLPGGPSPGEGGTGRFRDPGRESQPAA